MKGGNQKSNNRRVINSNDYQRNIEKQLRESNLDDINDDVLNYYQQNDNKKLLIPNINQDSSYIEQKRRPSLTGSINNKTNNQAKITIDNKKNSRNRHSASKNTLPIIAQRKNNSILSNISDYYKPSNQQSGTANDDIHHYITAKSWLIYDNENGQSLRGYRQHEQREIASLTKIMTFLVSLKLIKKFQLNMKTLYFSVSENAISQSGTSADLEEGQWILLEDLFYALMLPSGNDAANVLAENFGCLLYFYSIGQSKVFQEIHSVDVIEDIYLQDYHKLFITEMNKTANELGLSQTQFANVHGMAHRLNKSNCQDLAKLTYYALQYQDFVQVINTKSYTAIIKFVEIDEQVTEYEITWVNTNKLLDRGFFGVKTGSTIPAGSCLVSWYNQKTDQNEHINIIIVVLGCSSQELRFEDTIKLKDWWLNHKNVSKNKMTKSAIQQLPQ